MENIDFNKKLLAIIEAAYIEEGFPMIIPGEAPEEQEERENVTYSKTKTKGDASVTISANAKSMQDLHDVLRLAGITLPKDKEMSMGEPEAEQEVCAQCGDPDCTCPPGECDCGSEPEQPAQYTQQPDKSVITGLLRDKLKDYLRNGL